MVLTQRPIVLFTALVCLLLAVLPLRAAEQMVNAAFKQTHIELLPSLQLVESATPEVNIELPGDGAGQKILMPLQARGVGPLHRWVVFTVRNPELVPQDLVLLVPHQNFANSGVLWPRRNGSLILGMQASTSQPASNLFVLGSDAIAMTVAPGATVSYALELASSGLDHAMLWRRTAFDAQNSQYSFFRGVVIGIAMLLAIGFLCLFIVRPSAVFPAAGVFGWAAIGFIAFDAGYITGTSSWLPDRWQAVHTRAVIEALMLFGVILSLTTFLDLRRRSRLWRVFFIASALGAAAMAIYGWYEPVLVSGIARLAFAAIVTLGLALTINYWLRGFMRAQASLLPWTMLMIWTMLAAFSSLGIVKSDYLAPALAAGLVLVLVTMAFGLAQFAFDHGVSSYQFLRDSGRRALALAGSEQAVWDWQVGDGNLYVGAELERALGLTPGTVGGTDLSRWFDLIHPADRAAYVAGVEAAERRGRGTFTQEFRLRRADGSYRWYTLRARSMTSEEGGALRLIGTLADVTADKRAEERLLSDAVRDRVTGLPNKPLLLDRLKRAIGRAKQQGNMDLFVLVVDLDRFKNINDGLGHEAGDSILSVTGRRLAQLMGPEDSVGRLPGDQFAIVFNASTPKRDIITYAEAIRNALSAPIRLRTREVLVTASIGVAHFRVDRERPEDLLKDAEIALFEAKRRGTDMIEFFHSDMRNEGSELIALEQDLRRAVERNEIEVVYQPIMRLADGQLAGFEALVRWRHPNEGLLQPASFMGLAEETGIIRDIGRFVLNEAARQLGIWQRAFRPNDPLFVAVNVSSAQLIDFELVTDIQGLLNREDVQPGTLKLELTETLLMENPELSTKVLERIKQMGIGLACDDFGTGYSALAYLARLPFDTIKIDRLFLEADAEDERSAIILDTIILLAHDLELNVVVEGVENDQQVARLKELECDYAQGFFIGEPVAASQVLKALGGQPYGADNNRTGRTKFWDLLLGRSDALKASEVPAPVPAPRVPAPPPMPAKAVETVPRVSAPPIDPVPVSVTAAVEAADKEPPPTTSSDEPLHWPPTPGETPIEETLEIWPGDEAASNAALPDEPAQEAPIQTPLAEEKSPCVPAEPDSDVPDRDQQAAPEATAASKPKDTKTESAASTKKAPAGARRSAPSKKKTGQLKSKLRKAAKTRKAKAK